MIAWAEKMCTCWVGWLFTYHAIEVTPAYNNTNYYAALVNTFHVV